MPKKTRKEKILAQKRKATLKLHSHTDSVEEKITPHSSYEKNNVSPSSEADIQVQTYFMQDLKKSLRLIGIIITLEIVIYFGTINNYLSQILKFR